jgi:hypothetical protein
MKDKNICLKAGIAYADITPPTFTFMTGMGLNRPRPIGIHDRLYAKVLVLQDNDGKKIALVTVDMNYIDFETINEIRRLVEIYTDIKGENVKVTSSHCHSAPGFFKLRKSGNCGFYNGEVEKMKLILEEEQQHVHSAGRLIAGAIYEANLHLKDAEIGFGKGHSKYNIIRWHRVNKVNKEMRYIPYHRELSPNLKPLTEMFIMNVRENKTRRNLAFYYTNNAHCICVCLQSDEITADYPHCVAEIIEKKYGGLCMFAPGTIGDQHPKDFDRGFKAAEEMGKQLADEIIKAQKKMRYTSNLEIDCVEKEFDLPKDKKDKDSNLSFTKTRLSVIRLNDIILCFWPGEAFSMITRKLYKNSPFKKTYLVGNTDDFKNYFVFKKEFKKYIWDKDGAKPWGYDLSAGDKIFKVNMELLKKMYKKNCAKG